MVNTQKIHLYLYSLFLILSDSLAMLCRPSSSPAMSVHSVSYIDILTERCWDSEHYVDFFIGYNNCSYKNILKKSESHELDLNHKVRYINHAWPVKYTSLIRQALYTLV